MNRPGRVLGVDLGDVRTGLAISDPDRVVATPLDTLPVDDPADEAGLAAAIAVVAQERGATTVVVGLPRTLAGREERPAQRARRVADHLRRAGLDAELFDERFTTVEAERSMLAQGARRRERRAAVDRVAATLLLQAWLERRRGGA